MTRLTRARQATLRSYGPDMLRDAIARLQALTLFRTAAEDAELRYMLSLRLQRGKKGPTDAT
jgi:hypothetical protein